MTGVNVTVGGVETMAFIAAADLSDFVVHNPPGFTMSPYFMKCKNIHADVNLFKLASSTLNVFEIEEVRMEGLEINIEQQVGFDTNAAHIMDNVAQVEEDLLEDKLHRYIIKGMYLDNMMVNIMLAGAEVSKIAVPPMYVKGIGVKQHGVIMEELIGLAVDALVTQAMSYEDETVKKGVQETMTHLNIKPNHAMQKQKQRSSHEEASQVAREDERRLLV